MTKPRPLIVHFEFDQVEIFAGHIPPSKLHILFYNNRLATWHGFPDITHNIINVNNGRYSGHFEFDQVEFFSAFQSGNYKFCFIVIVPLSGTVFQILRLWKK